MSPSSSTVSASCCCCLGTPAGSIILFYFPLGRPRGSRVSLMSCFSLKVFKAVGFDPHAMPSTGPAGGPPPPQDALVCLHTLSSTASQLLHAFSRYGRRPPTAPSHAQLLRLRLFFHVNIVSGHSLHVACGQCFFPSAVPFLLFHPLLHKKVLSCPEH